jgi:HSP20 family protein
MNRMMQEAFGMVNRMDRMMNFDTGWDRLHASSTVDMRDRTNTYEVVVSLPGVDQSDVKVSLKGSILTISGKISSIQADSAEYRSFKTRIQLPGPVASNQVAKTEFKDGMLYITVPKADASARHRSTGLFLQG